MVNDLDQILLFLFVFFTSLGLLLALLTYLEPGGRVKRPLPRHLIGVLLARLTRPRH